MARTAKLFSPHFFLDLILPQLLDLLFILFPLKFDNELFFSELSQEFIELCLHPIDFLGKTIDL
jgi:hypothetical protein